MSGIGASSLLKLDILQNLQKTKECLFHIFQKQKSPRFLELSILPK